MELRRVRRHGGEGGISLKACACMVAKYCNAKCQKNHWSKHKQDCKQRAAELRDEALFKDPPAKEDCPICFLPVPVNFISCLSLPPATILSVPIYDFAQANEELANMETKHYYSCCGKTICGGCVDSFCKSGNDANCPYCKSEQYRKTDEERVEEMMKRVEANDAGSILMLAGHYEHGSRGLRQDSARAMELYTRAAELGSSDANFALGLHYHKGGDMKKAKFRLEAEAMAGHEVARNNLGIMEAQSGNMERAVKHWIIAASGGNHNAMYNLQKSFELGFVGEV